MALIHLKSNMDRFIDKTNIDLTGEGEHLKSNMDRFIVAVETYQRNLQRLI